MALSAALRTVPSLYPGLVILWCDGHLGRRRLEGNRTGTILGDSDVVARVARSSKPLTKTHRLFSALSLDYSSAEATANAISRLSS